MCGVFSVMHNRLYRIIFSTTNSNELQRLYMRGIAVLLNTEKFCAIISLTVVYNMIDKVDRSTQLKVMTASFAIPFLPLSVGY